MIKVAVPTSWPNEERRVALVPEVARLFLQVGLSPVLQSGAGEKAGFEDSDYRGVQITADEDEVFLNAKMVLFVGPPSPEQKRKIPNDAIIVGLLGGKMADSYGSVSAFSLELLPRISRAQSMDVLSSQNNLYGYWASIKAASLLQRVFPMMTTAAGGLKPAHIMVLGAGVAGLQAIATAKRLGAVVSAFDVRSSAKGAVKSLGATFIEVGISENGETKEGYACTMSEEYLKAQRMRVSQEIIKADGVICTALIPGVDPPILIDEEMVYNMKRGSVIIDLPTDRFGANENDCGNCVLSRRGKEIEVNGVRILGPSYGLSSLSQDASSLYSRNLFEFIKHMWDGNSFITENPDEIYTATNIKNYYFRKSENAG